MIEQIELWRRYLNKCALRLEKRFRQKRWSSRSAFLLEQDIFLGFYAIRKIMESKKFNPKLAGLNPKVLQYAYNKVANSTLDVNHPLYSYELFNYKSYKLSTKKLSDQFIHSYHFVTEVPLGGALTGFYFVSDWLKDKQIFYIKLLKVIEIFYSFYLDTPCKLQIAKDSPLRIKTFH